MDGSGTAIALEVHLKHLHRRPLHLVVDLDISLRGTEVLVARKLHDHLGRNPGVGELGNERASSAVAGSTVDSCALI